MVNEVFLLTLMIFCVALVIIEFYMVRIIFPCELMTLQVLESDCLIYFYYL